MEEAPSRAGIAWQGHSASAKINSFPSERGSQHGKGGEVCEAAEMGRVRKALSASRGVGIRSGSSCDMPGGSTGCEAVWEQRPFKGVPEEGVKPLVPTWFWST